MLDSIDNWILGQPSLINSRKKTILSVVQRRQTIADGLLRLMKELGIQRLEPKPKWPWENDEETEQSDSDQAKATIEHDGSSDTEEH